MHHNESLWKHLYSNTHFALALQRLWIWAQLVMVSVIPAPPKLYYIRLVIGMNLGIGLWFWRHKKTHRSLSLSHLSLLQTCFTGIQVQTKILQEAPFFLNYTQYNNEEAFNSLWWLNSQFAFTLTSHYSGF